MSSFKTCLQNQKWLDMKQAYWHTSIIPGLQRAIRESTSSRLGLCREVLFQEREKEEGGGERRASKELIRCETQALSHSIKWDWFIEESHIVVLTYAVLKRGSLQWRSCQVNSDKSQRFSEINVCYEQYSLVMIEN